MKRFSLLFCAFLSVLTYTVPAGAQPASSDYGRGYSAGLTAGRSCAAAPASRAKTQTDFSRGWNAGYAKGHTRCGKITATTVAPTCNPDVPAYSCHAGTTQPIGGGATPLPVQPSTCGVDVPAYSCHAGTTQPIGGGATPVPVQPPTCGVDVPAYSCHAGTTQPTGGGATPAPVQPPALGTIEACDAANPLFAGHPSPLTGKWYLYTGGTSEETWEFWGDSMFRHTWITSVGENTRTSERGRFELSGTSLTLHVTSRSGGGCKDEIRHASLQVIGNNGTGGLVLDGTPLKYASW